jgi:glycosyltransferase involved in cell wall biosynthesis
MRKKIQYIGKFFDNHSLSIVNRNLVLELKNKFDINILALDEPSYSNKVSNSVVEELMSMQRSEQCPDIEIRHTYPPIWKWPENDTTKVVFIQPWEYYAIPLEWQYKFETFADLVITPSYWTKQAFENSGLRPNSVVNIPNGYDPKVFYKEDKKERSEVVVLFVGCAQYRKGVDLLLNVWAHATKKEMPIKLIIKDTPEVYGKSSLYEDIIRLQYQKGCAKIEYDDSVKSTAEMAELYRSSDIIVHPYRAEGFAMHIQEAMACGTIPIVTRGGPTDEFVSDFKINSKKIYADMKSIFALKTEDSTTLMGAHKWVLEPDLVDLSKILSYVVSNINTISVDTTKLSTWSSVSERYEEALLSVVSNTSLPRRFSCYEPRR